MKTPTMQNDWLSMNQRYLVAALAGVRGSLEQYIAKRERTRERGSASIASDSEFDASLDKEVSSDVSACPGQADDNNTLLSALERLCGMFGLSSFECDILLICAGVELDAIFAPLCATAQSNALAPYPTFSLALAALPNPHWSALTPDAPLRRWRLVEVGPGSTLALSPLRIDERVLHYLTGLQYLDERLVGLVEPVQMADDLVPSHAKIAERLATLWSQTQNALFLMPIAQLCGSDVLSKRAIALATCNTLGLHLYRVSAQVLPAGAAEFAALVRLWEREALLSGSALLLECDEGDTSDTVCGRNITQMSEMLRGALLMSSRERQHTLQRAMVTFDVHKPTPAEQRDIWQRALGKVARRLDGQVEVLVSQFTMQRATILSAGAEVLESADKYKSMKKEELAQLLWDTCRNQARSNLDELAQRIEPVATWRDLILPELQCQILREMAAHVKQRAKVYDAWGFAEKGLRGLGISALFVGASGTGKTMAAEVLANELQLDLYRIDLSQVVSKYIGETEKNLRRVFDAAEEGGSILLFDEADALFGKRSEVKDSHDRYANIEVSYLLQRMEVYRGLAILTTNMKSALDDAFLRRLRFIVQFPFPDAAQRHEIWQRIFPPETPTEGLDMNKLARLNVTGGHIRNIALNAAFLAADANEPVRMAHLLSTARGEYAKMEKSLTEVEIGGWI